MKIVEYAPEYAQRLRQALANTDFEAPLLRRDAYVHHFFLGEPRCRLYLLLSDDGEVMATLGSERVRIGIDGVAYEAAVLSNTYSMREGAFPFLYLHWIKSCEVGILFPGNALMRTMLKKQKRWQSVPGLKTYWLNWNYPPVPDEPLWKALLRPVARRLMCVDQEAFARRIARDTAGQLSVTEERRFSEDMVEPRHGFGFRLDSDVSHLNWRFRTDLDYVRYRIFRITNSTQTAGYVVLAEWPHCVVVSHCDGDDPEQLALGVLLAIATLNRGEHRYRTALLTSMHETMQSTFGRFGFRPDGREAPFAVAALGNRTITFKPGSHWLVNMDLGDSGTMAGMVPQK